MTTIFNTLTRESDKVISIVGAGGKTSLMFILAHAFQEKGIQVVTTTTTHILKPTSQQTGGVVLLNRDGFQEKLEEGLKQYGHVTVASRLLSSGNKMQGLTCAQVEQMLDQSSVERILIEADGARQLSFKAPGDNEPVVPKIIDVFISVLGLDIIGKPLDDAHAFRAALVSARTGLQMGAEITALTVAKVAVHPEGMLKGCPKKARSYIVLNKTDIPGGREKALSVMEAANKLAGRKPNFWVSASIRENVCEIFG
ncbi:MAG: selenium cofactor biosynthesis protein YqeC [Thermodesulfobacteriota bacterium]|nr:selenium cofactor biosynthesis protein YqeC [Thermodesulfobacteriota bacterium]